MQGEKTGARGVDQRKLQVGRRIRRAREDAQLTQLELSIKVGVTPGAVGQWETGRSEPSSQNIGSLAKILGVSYAWIVGAETSHEKVTQTRTEDDMLRLYRKLSEDEQHFIIRQMEGLTSGKRR